MSFLMGAIGGWPPPSEHYRVVRQVNMDTPLFLRNAWQIWAVSILVHEYWGKETHDI